MSMRFLSIIIVVTLLSATQIHAKSVVDRVSRIDLDNEIQIFLFFDHLPDFEKQISNKRLDISLSETAISDDITIPSADENIVKTLFKSDKNESTLSFFFRYIPQDIHVSAEEAHTLVIDIVPGNRFTGAYKNITDELGTVFIVNKNTPYPVNPINQSPYTDNWQTFFTSYRSRVALHALEPPLSVYIPPFPWIQLIENYIDDKHNYPEQLIDTLEEEDWLTALTLIQDALKNSPQEERKKYLAFLHAEILFRLGNVNGAANQLKLLTRTYKNESIGIVAHYLSFLIEARKGAYHLAHTGLRQIAETLTENHPIISHVHLALLETGLALRKAESISDLVANFNGGTDDIAQRFSIRTADALWIREEYEQALQHYTELDTEPDLYQLPFSLHGYCSTLFQNRLYDRSSECFQKLADTLMIDDQKAAALYLAATVYPEQSTNDSVNQIFNQIIIKHPHTEAASRVEMLRADKCIYENSTCMGDAAAIYSQLSNSVKNRDISSEALFKKALTYHLNGNDPASVDDLMILLRNFQSGEIRRHASALLIQLLPVIIGDLLETGDDIEAIATAQQNRLFFDNRWIDLSVLYNLTPALERLGLYREAIALLLFLSKEYDQADHQEIYLTLTSLAYLQGDIHLVEDFSSHYFHNFPNGRYYNDILFYRVNATYSSGRIDQAEDLLPNPLPGYGDFRFLSASINFQHDNFYKSADLLLQMHTGLLPDDQLFILAESLYELGRVDEAEKYFYLLEDIPDFKDMALYRIAQIEQGRSDSATDSAIGIYQLRKLAESGSNTPWQRFAAQQLRYIRLMEML